MLNDHQSRLGTLGTAPNPLDRDLVFARERLGGDVTLVKVFGDHVAQQDTAARRVPLEGGALRADRFLHLQVQIGVALPEQLNHQVAFLAASGSRVQTLRVGVA